MKSNALPIILICWIIFAVAYLSWVRKGHGGWFGNKIRQSDWHCWNEAVKEKQQELEELKQTPPPFHWKQRDWLDTIQDVSDELEDIIKAEPRR